MKTVKEIEFRQRIERGIDKMSASTVAICVLARDCEETLGGGIDFIESLRKFFKESYVVVIENDSRDNTKAILRDWEKNKRGVYLKSEDYNLSRVSKKPGVRSHGYAYSAARIAPMARYRNQYLEFVRDNFQVDYLIAIDSDVFRIELEGILNSFGFEEDWDCITSNGRKVTLNHPIFPSFYDSYAFKEEGDRQPTTIKKMRHTQKKYKNLKSGMDFIRILSGFNGLAIYRWEAIKNIQYRLKENNDEVVKFNCEHVTFHEDMARLGYDKIYLNPSQIVIYDKVTIPWYLKQVKKAVRRLF